VLDHHFYYASGTFTPTHAFTKVQALFEQSPKDIYFTDLFGESLDAQQELAAFCQARDALHLQLQRSDGKEIPSRIVTIWFDTNEQLWKLLVHAESESNFVDIAHAQYLHASEIFNKQTRLWPEEHTSIAHSDIVIAKVRESVARKTKNNPIIIDEPGTRRRDMLSAIVAAIRDGTIAGFEGWNIVELSADVAHYPPLTNQGRHTLYSIIWQAYHQTPRSLFVIENFDRLSYWAGPLLKPFLARGQMRLIGTATLADYRQHIERDAAIQRRMQEIVIPNTSPSPVQTSDMPSH